MSDPPSHPLVSAIFITNRVDDVLRTAVDSVLAQDYRPLEMVIFWNGIADPGFELPEGAEVTLRTGSSPTDLGVAGGRNAAAALGRGELLLFIDDDARLRDGAVSSAVNTLTGEPDIGAVAFHIRDPQTGNTALWRYPHEPEYWSEHGFDAPWVIGCGNLVRRDVFERLKGFWTGYVREMEEIDFSWRLIDAGYRIRFDPRAVVEHPERPASRRLYRNAIPSHLFMAWRLLPAGLALRQSLLRGGLFALRALRHREFDDLLVGARTTLQGAPRVLRERAPLQEPTVAWLRTLHGSERAPRRLPWSLRRTELPE